MKREREVKQNMKRLQSVLYCIILCLFFLKTAYTVYAEEISPERQYFDIIFVIDCSGSMKTNDQSKIGLDMVQAFVDTMQTEGIRIGYVAYNDKILSYSKPESIDSVEKREDLKKEIASITYSGDTDIGLGVSYAQELLSKEENTRQIIVLISDGETDLPAGSSRTVEQSNQELERCTRQCKENNVAIYTIAFGQYDGNKGILEEIAKETDAESYSAESPENLIEVLYGIFQDNLLYRIQKFSSGTYAGGNQEITCVIDTSYINEINILLLSSETVGETTAQYGGKEFQLANLSHYAAGKIEGKEIDAFVNELEIYTATKEKQDLQVYVISYRGLMPVLEIDGDIGRNKELKYSIYFKDKNGKVIVDASFYESFLWELSCMDSDAMQESVKIKETEVQDGILKGTLQFTNSGIYTLEGKLSDGFGYYLFPFQIKVSNHIPSGAIPEKKGTLLEHERVLYLDDYFTDEDGDALMYSVLDTQEKGVHVQLHGNQLTLIPQSTGKYFITLQISDGEDVLQYTYHLEIVPLWKIYWWIIALVLVMVAVILWKLIYKKKPELERLIEEKKQNQFCGKLDAYFLQQPEGEDEIPPLSFQMNRIKDNRVSLGSLFGDYQTQSEALQLDSIFLIADERHNIILYHTSKSNIMIGNAIACRQIQYSVHFGDVLYITSQDGNYDLEIHYVVAFQ